MVDESEVWIPLAPILELWMLRKSSGGRLRPSLEIFLKSILSAPTSRRFHATLKSMPKLLFGKLAPHCIDSLDSFVMPGCFIIILMFMPQYILCICIQCTQYVWLCIRCILQFEGNGIKTFKVGKAREETAVHQTCQL